MKKKNEKKSHDGGAKYTTGKVNHFRVPLFMRDASFENLRKGWSAFHHQDGKTDGDNGEQDANEPFQVLCFALQPKENDDGIREGDQHLCQFDEISLAPVKRAKGRYAGPEGDEPIGEQFKGNGGPNDFCHIGGNDGNLSEKVERPRDVLVVMRAAGLGQVESRDDAQFDTQMLQTNRHCIGDENDEKKRVAIPGTTLQIHRPVARVQVADGNQPARTNKF